MKWWKEEGPGVRSSPSSVEWPCDPGPSDPTSKFSHRRTVKMPMEYCVYVSGGMCVWGGGVARDDPCTCKLSLYGSVM